MESNCYSNGCVTDIKDAMPEIPVVAVVNSQNSLNITRLRTDRCYMPCRQEIQKRRDTGGLMASMKLRVLTNYELKSTHILIYLAIIKIF